MTKKRIAILACLVIFTLQAFMTASPQVINNGGKVRVTQVSVTATPENYSGTCPKKVTYTARISASGSGEVRYRWLLSDNPLSQIKKTYFKRSSSKIIKITREYNANGTYWAAMEIVSPNSMTSSRATCRVLCIPVVTRPSFRISGNVNGGAEGRLLSGRKVKVLLKRSGRTLMTRTLTLDSMGRRDYEFGGPFLAAGDYTLTVEKVASDPRTATGANVCFRGTNPPSRRVTLSNTAPTARNQDFTINFVIAWDSTLCW
jgi:hypothetical protein